MFLLKIDFVWLKDAGRKRPHGRRARRLLLVVPKATPG